MRLTSISVAIACAVTVAPCAAAADDNSDGRWGVTIWGLSYHINKSIDYEANNFGAGLRYYVSRHLFVEGDALPAVVVDRWFDSHAEAIAALPELFARDESDAVVVAPAATPGEEVVVPADRRRPH